MQLTGSAFLIVIVVLAVATVAAVPVLWDSWHWRRSGRTATVLTAVAVTLSAVGVAVNDQGYFYPTWTSLIGGDPSGVAVGQQGVRADVGSGQDRSAVQHALSPPSSTSSSPATSGRSEDAAGGSEIVRIELAGATSHIDRAGAVYLPRAYLSASPADLSFPVVEMLSGSPGSPAGELHFLQVKSFLDAEIAAHRMPPTIVVIPATNPTGSHDDECVDAVRGDHDDAYLSTDVRNDMIRAFRVRTDRLGWAVMGYSTGGFCAANLALRHPGYYGTAVSMSGYFTPLTDPTTGDLYGRHDGASWLANDPQWAIQHRPIPPTAFFLSAGVAEPSVVKETEAFFVALRPPASAMLVLAPRQGHSFAAWRQQMPAALDWIGQRFGGALAPPTAPLPGERVTVKSDTGATSGPATTLAAEAAANPPGRPASP